MYYFSIVLDLPSTDHVTNLLKSKEHLDAIKGPSFKIVVDFSPQNVVQTSEYEKLISLVDTKVHLHLNKNNEYEFHTMKLKNIDNT